MLNKQGINVKKIYLDQKFNYMSSTLNFLDWKKKGKTKTEGSEM